VADLIASPPDFLGLGAPRSGTAWWYSLLAQHPRFHDPVRVDGRAAESALERFELVDPDDAAAEAFSRRFARPSGTVTGEWAPHLLFRFWVGAATNRVAPDAKLLVLLRDPVARFASEMADVARRRRVGRWRSARTRRAGQVNPNDECRCFAFGMSGRALQGLEAEVGAERVLVLQYERCVAAPDAELARTLEFLELEPFAVETGPRAGGRVIDSGAARALTPERRALLVEAYRADVEALVGRHPEIDLAAWESFA
jgi:Sulfotransferase family